MSKEIKRLFKIPLYKSKEYKIEWVDNIRLCGNDGNKRKIIHTNRMNAMHYKDNNYNAWQRVRCVDIQTNKIIKEKFTNVSNKLF